jgi:hypothetical protein
LRLVGLVGLLLLIGGGAFLWVTKAGGMHHRKEPAHRVKPRGNEVAGDLLNPDGHDGADQATSLGALLAGIEDMDTLETETARTGVTEAPARKGSSRVSQQPLPAGKAPYDWRSDPDSSLV